jgi:uncharacterized membrane protein (DUF485 family)
MSELARKAPTQAEARAHKNAQEIIASPDFKKLVAKRWTVSMVLLALLFVCYYGYILLVALNKQLMATRIGAVTTLAIPIGIGVIVVAWALTAFYVGWANRSYDPEVERLKGQLKH